MNKIHVLNCCIIATAVSLIQNISLIQLPAAGWIKNFIPLANQSTASISIQVSTERLATNRRSRVQKELVTGGQIRVSRLSTQRL